MVDEEGGMIADCGLRIPPQPAHPNSELEGWVFNPKSEIEVGYEVNQEDMKQRTRQFALRIIRLVESLPKGRTAEVIARQLLCSGTSVGANYRAACRAKSTRDFISKMGIVEEEADETLYWMEMLSEADIVESEKLALLMKEADELLAIAVASIKTAREKIRKT